MDPARHAMKALLIALLTVTLITLDARGDCTGTCPDGYLSTCVEREDCKCRCSCVKKTKAAAEVRDLLKAVDVSPQGIERGVKLFNDELKTGKRAFIVEFEDKGLTIVIRVSSHGKND